MFQGCDDMWHKKMDITDIKLKVGIEFFLLARFELLDAYKKVTENVLEVVKV